MLSNIRFPWTVRRASAAPKHSRRALPGAEPLEGRELLSAFTVTNTADSGTGSLRWAITQADKSTSPNNTINFKISGSGVRVIRLASALPAITSPVTIDGTSQSGYSGHPVVDLTGSSRSFNGVDVKAPNVTIKGFAIGGFNTGVLIESSRDAVQDCYIGTDPTGQYAVPNDNGVVISAGSTYNTVGGSSSAAGDLISGNNYAGVDLEGDHNVVENCFVGIDGTGRHALGNYIGVEIHWASYNTVAYNVISANTSIGVQLSGWDLTFRHYTTGNCIEDNIIGSDPSERYNLGNGEGVELYVVSGNSVVYNDIFYNSHGGVVETDYYQPRNTVAHNHFYRNYSGDIVRYPGYIPGGG
jgi:hypothetical protein